MELLRDQIVSQIISRLSAAKANEGAVKVEGTWGSFAPMLAALVCEKLNRPILYICPHIDDADKIADDIITFGGKSVETLPAWEGQIDIADATDEIRAERLRVALKLLSGQNNLVIPASIQAICQPIPKPQALAQNRLGLNINQQMPPEQIIGWLIDNSFEEV